MKNADGWFWPDRERHLLEWIANPKARMVLNGRPAYQGKKQVAALGLCPVNRRRTFIDVGAHVGLWSFNFSHWFKQVEAFEPVAEHRGCYMQNVPKVLDGTLDEDADKPGVRLYPYALGEREAMVSIHTDASSTGDSRVSGVGSIEMRTIDGFDFKDVDLIKLDTEGYEEFVLRGAEATIKEWKPMIVVEQKRDHALRFDLKPLGAVVYLKSLGYQTVDEISGDYFMRPSV
jgi:FkbM family methyltransferase